jgi:Cu(I)-responsive transcriptional regulator
MNIGEAAYQSGVPAKTIRYYEEIGLIPPAARNANNYRHYQDGSVRTLQFLKRARSLGFGIHECRELLSLYEDSDRSSGDVRALAQERVLGIDKKINELMGMRDTLVKLIERCHGDERPNCPILEDLAGR